MIVLYRCLKIMIDLEKDNLSILSTGNVNYDVCTYFSNKDLYCRLRQRKNQHGCYVVYDAVSHKEVGGGSFPWKDIPIDD